MQEPLEVIEMPGGRVLALVRQSGRGRQSGVPIVIHFFELCTIRDGKLSKVEYFRHRADALRALGLEGWAVLGCSMPSMGRKLGPHTKRPLR